MHGKMEGEKTVKRLEDNKDNHLDTIITFSALGISIIILTFISDFFISFIVCLIGYLVHTIGHFTEHSESNIAKSKFLRLVLPIIVFIGWIAYGFMLINEPIRIYELFLLTMIIGIGLTVLGFYIAYMAMTLRKGFREQDDLITTGIYGIFRHPLYIGLILFHIGIPLIFSGYMTLLSIIFWIPIIFVWMKIDEITLKKIYGEKYIEYMKKTIF